MRHFILFQIEEFAEKIKNHYANSFLKNTPNKLVGVNVLEGDVFIIDAHYGKCKSEMYGLHIANEILKNSTIKPKIIILSWFNEEYLGGCILYKNMKEKFNVTLFQLPNYC